MADEKDIYDEIRAEEEKYIKNNRKKDGNN